MAKANKTKNEDTTADEVGTPVKVDIDVGLMVADEVAKHIKGLEDKIQLGIGKAVAECIDFDAVVVKVLEQVQAMQSDNPNSEKPSWVKIDPEQCYQQCFERALLVVTTGQNLTYMKNKSNCASVMKQVISLTNQMFDIMADEYDIPS